MSAVLDKLKDRFEEAVIQSGTTYAHDWAVVDRRQIFEILHWLKLREGFDFDLLLDIAGVDYRDDNLRFAVVYHLYSTKRQHRLRISIRLREDDLHVDSVTPIWKAADWFEREAYDMYGIVFDHHPHLKRLLMWEGWEGYPLRKDYPCKRRQAIPETCPDLFGDHATLESKDLHATLMTLNLGPSHPAMHGALRVQVRLDGETIQQAACEIGYLHRCFEKHAEESFYQQIIPYSDRLNYLSALMNNVGYCKTVEDLYGITIPERAQYIRVIICELSRIMDHLVCIGTNIVDIGGLTNFWYFFNARERIYLVIEKLTGARLTYSYTRIGGVSQDLPRNFGTEVMAVLNDTERAIKDVMGLVGRNRIFLDRTQGIGAISKEEAVGYGFTGPCLRACGLDLDLRKAAPYYHYDEFDFDIPVGEYGDTYDRIMVRIEEMRQSMRIVDQALRKLPDGPIQHSDHRITLPEKSEVYGSIEGLMNHFKLVYEGLHPPKGEIYSATEAANGELGFYLISDGGPKPYRLKVRPPCFPIFSAYPRLIEGGMIADAIAILGSINIVVGELDR